MKPICPLCSSADISNYFKDQKRRYYQCAYCRLVFVDFAQRLGKSEEKEEYDLHQNLVDDIGYRRFLSRVYSPLVKRIKSGSKGLDFGCGEGPALSIMFSEAGFSMNNYDVFYCDDKSVLQERYNFITATEVAEHLFEPGVVLQQLWNQLEVGGVLALMTKLVIDKKAFSRWHYKNDQTHVCFFSKESFQWLAKKLNAKLEIIDKDVVFLSKIV